MDERFDNNEELFRAIRPPEVVAMFWKENGTLSSAAFKDPNGLSVERGYGRTHEEVVNHMRKNLSGYIFFVTAGTCFSVKSVVIYLPSQNNKYHSEIHRSESVKMLSSYQCKILAMNAKRVS